MYEVIGESIKSATSIKLGEIFNGTNIYRYKESITNMQYPNFFIYQVSANIEPERRNRWHINYLMNIKYREVSDVETITNIQQKLDAMALTLLTEFTEIELETPIKVKNARYEKADGILEFFFNIEIQVKRNLTEEEKMRILELNERLKIKDNITLKEELEQERP